MPSSSLFSGVADSTMCHTLSWLGGIDFCYCSCTYGAVNLEVTVPAKWAAQTFLHCNRSWKSRCCILCHIVLVENEKMVQMPTSETQRQSIGAKKKHLFKGQSQGRCYVLKSNGDTAANINSNNFLRSGKDVPFQTLRIIRAAATTPDFITVRSYFDILGNALWSPSRHNLGDTGIVNPTHFPLYCIYLCILFPRMG